MGQNPCAVVKLSYTRTREVGMGTVLKHNPMEKNGTKARTSEFITHGLIHSTFTKNLDYSYLIAPVNMQILSLEMLNRILFPMEILVILWLLFM